LVAQERLALLVRRVLSFVVDDIVVSLLFVAIFYERIATLREPEAIQSFLQLNLWVLILLKILYHTFFIGYNGMTLGKYLAKIRAVSQESGELLGYPMAFLRAVVRIPDEMFFYLGFLPAFFSPWRQTLHDRVSGCVVVHA
jgi:uncharacterized RDD family membrane protein YckC